MFIDEVYERIDFLETVEKISGISRTAVERILSGRSFDISALPALLSPAAADYIEQMAQIAAERSRERFGNTILLYAPLYLSNECINGCRYCGFSAINKNLRRRTLTISEVEREFGAIIKTGIKHILLVSGEQPIKVNIEYLKEVIGLGVDAASSLGIEIYPLDIDDYKTLSDCGAENLVIYQETYEQKRYRQVHPSGKKKNIFWRIAAPDWAGIAGFWGFGVGALLGLNENAAADVYFAALHADYLRNRYWRANISISLPRLRYAENLFKPHAVTDAKFVQYLLALRIVFYDIGLTLSTRETSALRDNLIGLGITQLSAASKTEPGGYTEKSYATPQFYVEDSRSVEEVLAMLKDKGFEGVAKDSWRQDIRAQR
ncbi:MAG: 2-iminoacetate synthase ThiH [Deferribacteraceae bacterium]|jgi:2-iminoacetate synthase|nr:2-iminoacetate synthase ThiH [Deferribacteraceae bacterium]